MRRLVLMAAVLLAVTFVAACGDGPKTLTPVKLMLDWVPNTNHTGIYVARDKGYFEEAGLDVEILEPGEVYPEAAVAGGAADFGISFQENVTLARAEGGPIVSVAAVMQHNTSGFASLRTLGVTDPAGFAGLRYGAYGSPSEAPTLRALMQNAGADFSRLQMVTTGFADPLALLKEGQIDLAWIFYGWQGIQAKQLGLDLDIVMMQDYFDAVPDFYTPVVITSEATITENPDMVAAVVKALSRGYTFAVEQPGEAAKILLAAVPELDSALVNESQSWVSGYYIADAGRWGEQKEVVWRDYSAWLVDNGVLPAPVDPQQAFTNRFLP